MQWLPFDHFMVMTWTQASKWMWRRIATSESEMRLDRWMHQQFPHTPQSFIQKQLRKRKIRLGTAPDSPATGQLRSVRAKEILQGGSIIAIDAHLFGNALHAPASLEREVDVDALQNPRAQQLLRSILYHDENYIIINKPPSLATQRGTNVTESLVDYLPTFAAKYGGETPRLVHRLDRATSGILVLARSRRAAAKFGDLLQNNKVHKTYHALVEPQLDQSKTLKDWITNLPDTVVSPVDEKRAKTQVGLLDPRTAKSYGPTDGNKIWLELCPKTGRKHQLRVHCSEVLHSPIVGDEKYGGSRHKRLLLHAYAIAFSNPFDANGKRIVVKSLLRK